MPEASSWLAGFKRERREQGRALRQYLLVEGEGGRVEARDVLADAEPDKGAWYLLEEEREVLAAHRGVRELQGVLLAEEGPDHTKRQTGRAFVVHGHGVGEVVVELGVAAHPPRDAAGQLLYPLWHPAPQVLVQGADGAPEPRRLGDDVEGATRPDLPHRQHRRLDPVDLPRDQGLQRRHDLSGHGDGVDSLV